MLSVKHVGWLSEDRGAQRSHTLLAVVVLISILAVCRVARPNILPAIFFFRQDLPMLCAMTGAVLLFAHLRLGGRWWSEWRIMRPVAIAGAALIVAVGVVGRRVVMLDYDLSLATNIWHRLRRVR